MILCYYMWFKWANCNCKDKCLCLLLLVVSSAGELLYDFTDYMISKVIWFCQLFTLYEAISSLTVRNLSHLCPYWQLLILWCMLSLVVAVVVAAATARASPLSSLSCHLHLFAMSSFVEVAPIILKSWRYEHTKIIPPCGHACQALGCYCHDFKVFILYESIMIMWLHEFTYYWCIFILDYI